MRSLSLLAICCVLACGSLRAEVAQGERGIVASVHPLATQAGIDAMKSGGNAIDAAVAVALTLGVVDGHNSGIGGGCFMLIRRANGEFVALDGREMAPAAATRDMFMRNGKGDTELSQTGALASAVPGALAVYEQVVSKYGRKKLADLLLPAAQIAEDGFPIDFVYARKLKSTAEKLQLFDSPRGIFFKPDGAPLNEGDVLKQPDLARSYRAMATDGVDWFYRGSFATAVAAWMKEHGGILTEADFANYVVKQRAPLVSDYRGYTIVGILDLGLPLDEALAQPRIHHQWLPNELRIEKALPAEIQTALKKRGHPLDEQTTVGASQVVGLGPDAKSFLGASEPRAGGIALGF